MITSNSFHSRPPYWFICQSIARYSLFSMHLSSNSIFSIPTLSPWAVFSNVFSSHAFGTRLENKKSLASKQRAQSWFSLRILFASEVYGLYWKPPCVYCDVNWEDLRDIDVPYLRNVTMRSLQPLNWATWSYELFLSLAPSLFSCLYLRRGKLVCQTTVHSPGLGFVSNIGSKRSS